MFLFPYFRFPISVSCPATFNCSLIPPFAVIAVLVIGLLHHWLSGRDRSGGHHQAVCWRVLILILRLTLQRDTITMMRVQLSYAMH